tara:strand:- start:99 stop:254 length:156 start_codon:yes stop_codon:yes gene_type:complete
LISGYGGKGSSDGEGGVVGDGDGEKGGGLEGVVRGIMFRERFGGRRMSMRC